MKAGGFMTVSHRSIFRGEAVRRYIQNHEEAVLPRLICPRTFLCLWVLLGVLLIAGYFLTARVRGRLQTPTSGHEVPASGS
jgi:hypothetical protein